MSYLQRILDYYEYHHYHILKLNKYLIYKCTIYVLRLVLQNMCKNIALNNRSVLRIKSSNVIETRLAFLGNREQPLPYFVSLLGTAIHGLYYQSTLSLPLPYYVAHVSLSEQPPIYDMIIKV